MKKLFSVPRIEKYNWTILDECMRKILKFESNKKTLEDKWEENGEIKKYVGWSPQTFKSKNYIPIVIGIRVELYLSFGRTTKKTP